MFCCLVGSMTGCGRAQAGADESTVKAKIDFLLLLFLSLLEHDLKWHTAHETVEHGFSP